MQECDFNIVALQQITHSLEDCPVYLLHDFITNPFYKLHVI